MALLSRIVPASEPTPQPKSGRGAPPVAIVENCVEAKLAETLVVALPEGALWIEAGRALVVADLHLEKASAFAGRGQLLPPYDTRATLARLKRLIDAHAPDTVISLGDGFHDGGGPQRLAAEDRATLAALMARADWVWIEGNHDGRAAETLGGAVRERLQLGALSLRHEPTGAEGEIAGHLHPCARVAGRGSSVRRRCFGYDGQRMVLPAFGALTGGLNLTDATFAPIFPDGALALVLGRERVFPAPPQRLLRD